MVVRDLAVTLADGGDCLSDLCVLRDHPDLFGGVASDATAWLDVLDDALAQVPSRDFPEPGLVREAIIRLPEDAWVPSITQDTR